jgi:hypothetical protein
MFFDYLINNHALTRQTLSVAVVGLMLGVVPSVSAETDCQAQQCDANGENCQRVSLMPVAQCETLLAIYQSTDGENWWRNQNWNTTNEPRDFVLVDTADNGQVVALNLFQNNLQGQLPDLSALTSLKELVVRNNQLTGKIPRLTALTQLEKVSFYENQLCGPIPDLTGLSHLKQLDLSDNQLTGPIPDLSQLKNLETLGLAGNLVCRDKDADYAGFENLVSQYPLCSDDDVYPPCVKYLVSVHLDGNGNVIGDGIDCGSDCDEKYDENTVVTLTANPAAESTFAGWSGACSGTDLSCQISLTQAQQVTATFDRVPSYVLTVNKAGDGTGSVTGDGIDCGEDCNQEYIENTEVSLTAVAADDSTFAEWSGACSGTDACQVSMTEAQNVIATFELVPIVHQYALTVNKQGDGSGNVTGDGIDCGDDCNQEYTENTDVSLTAIPADDSTFAGWSGACSGTDACQVLMTKAQNVTATFELVPIVHEYELTVNKLGTGAGSVVGDGIDCGDDCHEIYTNNTEVTLVATPATDSYLVSWNGACAGTEPCQLIMNQAQTVTATFNLIPVTEKVDLEFVGLKDFYQIGEFVTLDLVEYLQTPLRTELVDLWVAVESPDNSFYYMTELPLQPFSLKPQPYRRGIVTRDLVDTEARYHLLYFDVPAGVGGTYSFYAIYNEAEADLSQLIKTQQSNLAFASTVLSNNLNPSSLSVPSRLTMLVGEELELSVDSDTTLDAIRSNCHINPAGFVQSQSAVSDDGNGISCYLKAIKPGSVTLTTVDKDGNTLETAIIVR